MEAGRGEWSSMSKARGCARGESEADRRGMKPQKLESPTQEPTAIPGAEDPASDHDHGRMTIKNNKITMTLTIFCHVSGIALGTLHGFYHFILTPTQRRCGNRGTDR